jgi:hypothetical protein
VKAIRDGFYRATARAIPSRFLLSGDEGMGNALPCQSAKSI